MKIFKPKDIEIPICCSEQDLIPYNYKDTYLLRCNNCPTLYINPREKRRKCTFCNKKKLTTRWGVENTYICKECFDINNDYDHNMWINLVKESVKTMKKCGGCNNNGNN